MGAGTIAGEYGTAGGPGTTSADRPLRRPRRRLLELALLSLVAVAIVLATVLRLPIADIKAVRHDNSRLELTDRSGRHLIPLASPIVASAADGPPVRLRADALIDGIVPQGSRAANRAWWVSREVIAQMLAAGPVAVRLPGGRTIVAASRQRTLADLTAGFWAALFTGFTGLLCGMWVLVMRPRNAAARTFAVMSASLFGVGCTLAAGYDPLLLGDSYRILMLINHACAQTFAAAILMLFCRFPTPLLPRGFVWAIGAAAILLTVCNIADWTADTVGLLFASIVVEFGLFVALIAGQAWAVRNDPIGSAAMRLIGFSAVLSSAFFVAMVILPMLISGAPLVSEGLALPLLLVIYAGLGAAIVRHRLFTVDGWAPALLLSVCAAVAMTAVDLSILSLVAGSRGIALPVAIVMVGLFYIPLREALMRRANRRHETSAQQGARLASEVAFLVTPEERAARWRAALVAIFDPLDIAPDRDPVPAPMLAEGLVALRLPPVGDIPGIVLRYAQRGARDFDSADLVHAREAVDLVERLIGARDAYISGVSRERARIARDLHDDVNARLLTSLNREDQDMMRRDVREAMADIRAIISGTAGTPRPLDDVLADLRFETGSRLETHAMTLHWPVDATFPSATIDFAAARHLASIVRETVSNIVRHAGASTVTVGATAAGGQLTLRIADDGVGFDAGEDAWGNGLTNCARRAQLLGGTLRITGSGTGTVAELCVPLAVAPAVALVAGD